MTLLMESCFCLVFVLVERVEKMESKERSNGGFIPAFGMRHFSLAAGQQEAPRTRVQWASVARITT